MSININTVREVLEQARVLHMKKTPYYIDKENISSIENHSAPEVSKFFKNYKSGEPNKILDASLVYAKKIKESINE